MMWTYLTHLYSMHCFIGDFVQECIESWRMTGERAYLSLAEGWLRWLAEAEEGGHEGNLQ